MVWGYCTSQHCMQKKEMSSQLNRPAIKMCAPIHKAEMMPNCKQVAVVQGITLLPINTHCGIHQAQERFLPNYCQSTESPLSLSETFALAFIQAYNTVILCYPIECPPTTHLRSQSWSSHAVIGTDSSLEAIIEAPSQKIGLWQNVESHDQNSYYVSDQIHKPADHLQDP